MEKQVVITIMSMFLISLASASIYDITSGESINITLEEEYNYYSIVGNTTEIDLKIYQNSTDITITLGKYNKVDTFELIFFDAKKEVIVPVYTGGGGSSRTIYIDKNTTVYVPEYIETIKEVEVEKVVESINYIDDEYGFKTWHIFLAMALGGCFIWFIMSRKDEMD